MKGLEIREKDVTYAVYVPVVDMEMSEKYEGI